MAVPGLLGKVGKAAETVSGGLLDQIRAYHGSPHDFPAERLVRLPDGREEFIVGQPGVLPDIPEGAQVLQEFPYGRFRMEKMGTGEGAQAFGAGMYAAEAEQVAKEYRDALTQGDELVIRTADGKAIRGSGMSDADLELAKYWQTATQRAPYPHLVKHTFNSLASDKAKKRLAELGGDITSVGYEKAKGKMYELNINAKPEELLDWDKPLSEQSEKVRSAIAKLYAGDDEILKDMLGPDTPANYYGFFDKSKGGQIYNTLAEQFGGPAELSEKLSRLGVKGINYKDAMSRGTEGGTSNFVVFDPRIIDIARKYGIPVPAAAAMLAGGLTPDRAAQAAMAGQMSPAELMRQTGGFMQANQALRQAEQNRLMPAMRGEMSGPQTAIQRGAFDVGMAADRMGLGGTSGAYMNVAQGARPGLIDAILSGVELYDPIGSTQLGQGLLSR